MKSNIVYLPIDKLSPHPNNPRVDLGDLTELAASIEAQGILQNLTVVPAGKDAYTVVIGHRRHAAAKLAGLTEVPCSIADMDLKEQVGTMLLENMQRQDLTYVEQADGIKSEYMRELADRALDKDLEHTMLILAYATYDDNKRKGYSIARDWMEEIAYTESEQMDALYAMLQSFGYQLNQEEKELKDGTHEIYDPEEDDEEESHEAS